MSENYHTLTLHLLRGTQHFVREDFTYAHQLSLFLPGTPCVYPHAAVHHT